MPVRVRDRGVCAEGAGLRIIVIKPHKATPTTTTPTTTLRNTPVENHTDTDMRATFEISAIGCPSEHATRPQGIKKHAATSQPPYFAPNNHPPARGYHGHERDGARLGRKRKRSARPIGQLTGLVWSKKQGFNVARKNGNSR